jgi:hypothetical protein
LNENETLTANEIVGQPILAEIGLQTRPLPLYTTNPSGVGSVFTFATLLIYFNLKKMFSKKNNSAETLLGYSGSIVCVRTEKDLVFIACNERDTTRDLTHELSRFPLSDLVSCDFDNYPRSSEVKFDVRPSQRFSLHFVGKQSDVVEFISSTTR